MTSRRTKAAYLGVYRRILFQVVHLAMSATYLSVLCVPPTRRSLALLSIVSCTLENIDLMFAPLVSPLPARRLMEVTYPGDHEKVGAGQPTDWVTLPGKRNDSPWLGPTFREEETTYLGT